MLSQCDTADWNSSLHRGKYLSGQANAHQTTAATLELHSGVATFIQEKREATSVATELWEQAMMQEQASLSLVQTLTME
jgi:hypothetical protein